MSKPAGEVGWIDLFDPEIEYIPPANDAKAFEDEDEATVQEPEAPGLHSALDALEQLVGDEDLDDPTDAPTRADEDEATQQEEAVRSLASMVRQLAEVLDDDEVDEDDTPTQEPVEREDLPESQGPVPYESHLQAVLGEPQDALQSYLVGKLDPAECEGDPRAAAAILKVQHDLTWLREHPPSAEQEARTLGAARTLLMANIPGPSELLQHWAEALKAVESRR